MKFKEISSAELISPASGVTITDIVNVRGVHLKAFCMMQGYSIRREADDMQMRQFKFFSKAIRDDQNSTATNSRFLITTKIIHFGNEDDFWIDNHDTLRFTYNVLVIIP